MPTELIFSLMTGKKELLSIPMNGVKRVSIPKLKIFNPFLLMQCPSALTFIRKERLLLLKMFWLWIKQTLTEKHLNLKV